MSLISRPSAARSLGAVLALWSVFLVGCSDRVVDPERGLTPAQAARNAAPRGPDDEEALLRDTKYVALAGGVYHKSCVFMVPNGGHTRGDTVFAPSGEWHVNPPCRYRSIPTWAKARGQRPTVPASSNTGWVVDARAQNAPNGSWRAVNSQWTVPGGPLYGYTYPQNFFLFNGLGTSAGILQPVLSWGQNGNNRWQIGVYYCQSSTCSGVDISTATIDPGDVITGTVTAGACSGGYCDFGVTMWDVTKSISVAHVWNAPDDAFATMATMEARYLSNCGDYPPGPVKFSNFLLTDRVGNQTPSLSKVWGWNDTPSCGGDLYITPASDSVTIKIQNARAYIGGPTAVNTGDTCMYDATMLGGWGAPYSSLSWSVPGATIIGGQGASAMNVNFPNDGSYTVNFSAQDARGAGFSAPPVGVTATTPTRHAGSC